MAFAGGERREAVIGEVDAQEVREERDCPRAVGVGVGVPP